jgi:hypothetical protein
MVRPEKTLIKLSCKAPHLTPYLLETATNFDNDQTAWLTVLSQQLQVVRRIPDLFRKRV